MSLSSDLISQFVKATKDATETKTETTVFGTIVYDGRPYVKLDGSDQLTPISTTADVQDGERVTVLIKNHTATVTGNMSSPAARTDDVKEVDTKVEAFKVVVADKVDTEQLAAQIARIDNLTTDNIKINEGLEATSASINELKAKDVTIENELNANKASIEELETNKLDANTAKITYATIENLRATNAEVNNFKATYGEFAELTTDKLTTIDAEFKTLDSKYATIENLDVEKGRIDTLISDNVTVNQNLQAHSASINELKAKDVTIENELNANKASIEELETNKLDAATANITYATIANLDAAKGRIGVLETNSLTANSALIKNLRSDVANIDTLIFGSASGDVIQTSFANAVIAQLGNAQIKSAMIDSVSASKINSGSINTNNVQVMSADGRLLISDETIQISDANRVRVQIGKDASGDYSINVWDASGKLMFSEGGITDSAIKDAIIRDDMVSDSANISAHKLNIDSLFEEINGSDKTIKSTKVYFDDKKQTLDVAFSAMTTDLDNTKDTVSSHGTQISVLSDKFTTKVWQQDIDSAVDPLNEKTDTLSTNYSSLQQTVGGISTQVAENKTAISKKADSATVTSVSNKVSSLEQTVSGIQTSVSDLSEEVEKKADNTTVTNIDNRVSTLSQTVTGFQTTVSNLSETVDTKADSSTVTTVSNKVSTLEQTVEGFQTTVSNLSTKVDKKADGTTVTNLSNKVTTMEQTVSGIQTSVSDLSEVVDTKADGTTVTNINNTVTSLTQDLSGFKTTVSDTYAKKSSLGDYYTKTETNSQINQSKDAILATVSETYATQDSLTGYYTKTQTDAAIKTAKDSITSSVSSTYATKDSLKSYYTKTETDSQITQSKDSIISTVSSTYATKDSLNGYYTKEQTNTQINQSKESIISTVSSTYSTKQELADLEVGGRNLLLNSKSLTGTNIIGVGSIAADTYKDFYVKYYDNSAGTSYKDMLSFRGIYPEDYGVDYTLSFYAKGSGTMTTYFYGATGYLGVATVTQSSGNVTTPSDGNSPWTLTSSWKRYWVTWTLKTSGNLDIEKYVLFRANTGAVVHVCGVKLERGNKPSAWTPAPEDIDNAILTSSDLLSGEVEGSLTTLRETIDGISASVEECVKDEEYDSIRNYVKSQMDVYGDGVSIELQSIRNQMESDKNGDDGWVKKIEEFRKYFNFTSDGLIIGDSNHKLQLVVDTSGIKFVDPTKTGDDAIIGYWDGDFFHTGNIYVETDKYAQFGNFAFTPRSDGSLTFNKFSKVGDN